MRNKQVETITSRKNTYIVHLRALGSDAQYRRAERQYICDGVKTLREALSFGACVVSVLWKDEARTIPGLDCEKQYIAPAALFDYASPMINSPGPLFCVEIPHGKENERIDNAIILENVQDPGNVGTVIRTANAFDIGAVILTGACADLYNPKTVRATMGAIFRQRVIQKEIAELPQFLNGNGLSLYAAALSDKAEDIRGIDLTDCAVAVGSEGRGLSDEFKAICKGELIIPMNPHSESLNAAVAASVVMWEMYRR